MDTPQPEIPHQPPWRPTLTHLWAIVLFGYGAAAGALLVAATWDPENFGEGGHSPLTIIAGLATILTQAVWISGDLQRRGRQVGWWRFWAILTGPIAITIYLIAAYRLRAFYLVPLCWMIYLLIGVPAEIALYLLPGAANG